LILARTYVQAQRREAWGEPPPDAESSMVRPRPYGRSAFASHMILARTYV